MGKKRLPAQIAALLGGGVLLVVLLAPIEWFGQESWGGLAGRNSLADQNVTAWEAFGGWIAPVVVAAALPLLDLAARAFGKGMAWELRLGIVAVGLGVLFVASFSELRYSQPPCCDIPYYRPVPGAGFLLGGIGGTLLLFGILASWPRRMPWQPRQTIGERG